MPYAIRYRTSSSLKTKRGFTLIEVLIAMILVSVGMLSVAATQAASLKSNRGALNRSQATLSAYDLADRMRANKISLSTYTAILPSAAKAKPNCFTTTGCNPAEIAENDLYEWNLANQTNLPGGGIGTIMLTSSTYTIAIIWDSNHDGSITSADATFSTSFQL